MPKGEPTQALLKRLQKIEQAYGRLGEIATRIRAQADTIADLVKLAQAFVNERVTPSKASRTRSAKAAPKRSPVKRGGRKAAPVRRPTAAKRATSAAPASPMAPARARPRRP
jgi:hypothetical protein